MKNEYLVILLLAFLCVLRVSVVQSLAADKHEPVRGICLASLHRAGMSYGSDACRKQLEEIVKLGGNWVAINDFAWMRAVDEPRVRFSRDRSMEGDVAQCIKDAHAA